MATPGDEEILPLANHDASEWPNAAPLKSAGIGIRRKLYVAAAWALRHLPYLPRAVIGFLIVIAGILVFWASVKAVFQESIVVDAILVTKELEAAGYSGTVITKRLLDEISRINQVSDTTKERAQLGDGRRDLLASVQLPTTGLSAQTIVTIVRDLFHRDETRIGGEVAGGQMATPWTAATKISLLIRTEYKSVRHAVRFEDNDLDRLIEQAAIEVLNRIDPYVLASYYYQMKLWDKMEQTIDHILATRDATDRKWALNLRGNRLSDQHKGEEAIAHYDRAILLDSDFSIAFINKGNKFGEAGDHEKAVEAYRAAVAVDPRSSLALNNWGVLLSQRDELDAAAAMFQRGIKMNPKDALLRSNLGYLWEKVGDRELAAIEYEAAFEIEPTAYHLTRLGVTLFQLNRRARAEARFEAALKWMPHQDVYNAWGDALLEVNELEDARQRFVEALNSNPWNAYAYVGIGRSWLAEGRMARAEEACGEAIAVDKHLVETQRYCGDVFERQKSPKAVGYYKEALALTPESSWILTNLARYFYAVGESVRGAENFEKALRIDPGKALIYLKWASLLFNEGDYYGALYMCDKAIGLNPNYEEAHSYRSYTLLHLGRDEEADRSDQTARDIADRRAAVIRPGSRPPISMIALYTP